MAELAIIADDLTGALDAAAPFAMRGVRTVVALAPADLPEVIEGGALVVGVSTNSREISPEAAREATRAAVAALPAGTRIFKKVDSRLKGNVEAELDAVPHRRSLVVPAIPAFGRWVRDGRLGGFGVSEPIDIAERLGRHAAAAIIPDIASQADIERALTIGSFDLPVGARGLAEAMAGVMAPNAAARDTSLPHGSAYCVIGSTDPITLAQVDLLRASQPDLAFIPAPNGKVAELPPAAPLTVIQAVPWPRSTESATVAAALAETLMKIGPAAGSLIVVSGGATAQVVLEKLGIRVLELVGEALPGLPIARANGLTVVTKSGGFGEPETLQRLLASFHTLQEPCA